MPIYYVCESTELNYVQETHFLILNGLHVLSSKVISIYQIVADRRRLFQVSEWMNELAEWVIMYPVLKFQENCLGRVFYNMSYSFDSKEPAILAADPSKQMAVANVSNCS